MTAKPLFVYGTLRDPDILDTLLGHRLPPRQRVTAHAPGFRAVHFPLRVYPALILSPDGNATGLALLDLTPIELAILDAFEGDEYRRDSITVQIASGSVDADVYLPAIAVPSDAEPWTLEQWTALHKPQVLDGEQRTAAALRERLAAPDKPDA